MAEIARAEVNIEVNLAAFQAQLKKAEAEFQAAIKRMSGSATIGGGLSGSPGTAAGAGIASGAVAIGAGAAAIGLLGGYRLPPSIPPAITALPTPAPLQLPGPVQGQLPGPAPLQLTGPAARSSASFGSFVQGFTSHGGRLSNLTQTVNAFNTFEAGIIARQQSLPFGGNEQAAARNRLVEDANAQADIREAAARGNGGAGGGAGGVAGGAGGAGGGRRTRANRGGFGLITGKFTGLGIAGFALSGVAKDIAGAISTIRGLETSQRFAQSSNEQAEISDQIVEEERASGFGVLSTGKDILDIITGGKTDSVQLAERRGARRQNQLDMARGVTNRGINRQIRTVGLTGLNSILAGIDLQADNENDQLLVDNLRNAPLVTANNKLREAQKANATFLYQREQSKEISAINGTVNQNNLLNRGDLQGANELGIKNSYQLQIDEARFQGNERKAIALDRARDSEIETSRMEGRRVRGLSLVDTEQGTGLIGLRGLSSSLAQIDFQTDSKNRRLFSQDATLNAPQIVANNIERFRLKEEATLLFNRDQGQQVQNINTQMKQNELLREGSSQEANELGINNKFGLAIDNARFNGQASVADALAKLRDSEIEQSRFMFNRDQGQQVQNINTTLKQNELFRKGAFQEANELGINNKFGLAIDNAKFNGQNAVAEALAKLRDSEIERSRFLSPRNVQEIDYLRTSTTGVTPEDRGSGDPPRASQLDTLIEIMRSGFITLNLIPGIGLVPVAQ